MGEFPSGQRGQTVNLLSMTSVVRIHLPPPLKALVRMNQSFFIPFYIFPAFAGLSPFQGRKKRGSDIPPGQTDNLSPHPLRIFGEKVGLTQCCPTREIRAERSEGEKKLKNIERIPEASLTPCGVRPAAPVRTAVAYAHFNPLTPCGVRPTAPSSVHAAKRFQSTHPVRGETRKRGAQARHKPFQSTHPVRGETSQSRPTLTAVLFQSTHPVRGETSATGLYAPRLP